MKLTALWMVCAALIASGCSRQNNPEPKAEASVSVNTDGAKDSFDKTVNDAERGIKKGAKEAKAKLEDAGEAIKDKFETAKDKLTDNDKPSIKVEVKKD